MRRRIRSGMLRFAKEVGAIQGERPDWYALAEVLAERFAPQLLDGYPVSLPAHRPPKENWYWLVHDVNLIRSRRDCTIKEACRRLSRGEKPHRVHVYTIEGQKGTCLIQSGKWEGIKPRTLEQRYYEWLQGWKKYQQEEALNPTTVNSGTLLP